MPEFVNMLFEKTEIMRIWKAVAPRLPLLVFILLYVSHFMVIWSNAVDVPYMDEWELLGGGALSQKFPVDWFFAQHNEHRMVTTKVLVWLQYRLTHWNLPIHQAINFLIYGLLIGVTIRFARKVDPHLKLWVIVSFAILLLSPLNSQNHFWGFQSTFHFVLLFFIGAVFFLFEDDQRWAAILIGSGLATLAIYSLSSGLVSAVVLLFVFCGFKLMRLTRVDQKQRKHEIFQLLTVTLILLTAIFLWFVDYRSVVNHPYFSFPTTVQFWQHFLNVIALGFGFTLPSIVPGFVCLGIIISPIVINLWRSRAQMPSSTWAVYAVILGILATVCSISIARASFGVAQSKSSRYAEFGMLLIPFTVLAWRTLFQEDARKRELSTALLGVFLFSSFLGDWSLFSTYQADAAERRKGLQCIERFYELGSNSRCPTIYPGLLSDRLSEAKALDISFYRTIKGHVGEVQNAVKPVIIIPKSARASNSTAVDLPSRSIDGDATTHWSAGGPAPQWIEFDLGEPQAISRIDLNVAQTPSGNTTHEVFGGLSPDKLRLLCSSEHNTDDGQWIKLSCPSENIRYLRVVTEKSPSWVAWREIEVYK